MVALGTTLSAFWIMVNNSWMQVPVGYTMDNGVAVPTDWIEIIFSPVVWVRFPHMLLAAYLDRRLLRCRHRCLVSAAAQISRRSAHHAAHGVWVSLPCSCRSNSYSDT